MATPTRQPSGNTLQNLGPSGTFLQQLLEEINGTRPSSAPPQPQVTSIGMLPIRLSTQSSRRTSSVWMGGGLLAQDARQKLRAADEARLRKASTGCGNTEPVKRPPALRLHVPDFAFPAPTAGSVPISPLDTSHFDQTWGESDSAKGPPPTPRPEKSAPSKPVLSRLRIPISTMYVSQPTTVGVVLGTESSTISCDINSEISSTPSTTEPPTSALSNTFTEATSVSGSAQDAHTQSGGPSPEKRALSPSLSPKMLTKKMRTRTVPFNIGRPAREPAASPDSYRRSIGGDNRYLSRTPTYTERGTGQVGHTSSGADDYLPELSSFRPEAADSQGLPLRLATPIKSRTSSKCSTAARNNTPERAETPIYARSLHLVDTDVSIYHKVHGDEWKENPLCLYCFRQHGGFSKLKEHGYETCGHDEPLESHYWEFRD